ncbi:MAG: glycosyltransferase [Acidobacteriota bacterium]
MQCYWAARGLAERGHQVFVVTNAEEVEETFRIRIPEADRAEPGMYAPSFPTPNGRVEVHSTTPPDRSTLYYIPMGNPTVSRLASRATDLIRKHDCKVIFSYYLEPYGMAAQLASYWTNIPYVFKHAGSDLHRLMPITELTTAYREVLTHANCVLSGGPSRRIVASYGVPEERIETSVGFGLPGEFFNAERKPLNLDALLREHSSNLDEGDPLRNFARSLDPNLPVLGIYGKMGEYKGTFDLLHAVGRLSQDGFAVQCVALSRGWQELTFYDLALELGVQKHLRVHPFIPHWQIPAFIRACDAVAFLERDFPIVAHTPTIPTEILSCGGCLIVSEEVLRKQLFRWKARDRQNLIVVSDPRNHKKLAEAIGFALADRRRSQEIGRAGAELVEGLPSYRSYIGALERVLERAASDGALGQLQGEHVTESLLEERREPLEMIGQMYPYVHALLDDEKKHRLRLAFQGSGVGVDAEDRRGLAMELGQQTYDALASDSDPSLIGDVCRYEYKMHQWSKYGDKDPLEKSKAQGSFPSDPSALVPVMRGAWEVQEFTFDVERVAEFVAAGEPVCDNAELKFASKHPVYVFFHEGSLPMRIGPSTAALVAVLDQERLATSELLSRLHELLRTESTESLRPGVLSALEGLYWEGAICFESAP